MEDWVHLEVPQEEKNPKTGERSIFLSLMAAKKGDYTITLDDLGLSKENVASSNFGKYEYESGTSMATPFITEQSHWKQQRIQRVQRWNVFQQYYLR